MAAPVALLTDQRRQQPLSCSTWCGCCCSRSRYAAKSLAKAGHFSSGMTAGASAIVVLKSAKLGVLHQQCTPLCKDEAHCGFQQQLQSQLVVGRCLLDAQLQLLLCTARVKRRSDTLAVVGLSRETGWSCASHPFLFWFLDVGELYSFLRTPCLMLAVHLLAGCHPSLQCQFHKAFRLQQRDIVSVPNLQARLLQTAPPQSAPLQQGLPAQQQPAGVAPRSRQLPPSQQRDPLRGRGRQAPSAQLLSPWEAESPPAAASRPARGAAAHCL